MLFILGGALHQLPGPDLAWIIEMRRNMHKVSVPKAEAKELFLAQEAAGAPKGWGNKTPFRDAAPN